MIGETLRVYYVLGDPVDNPKLRQDGAMDGLKYGQVYNPIVGYYGETRIDSKGNPKKHTGFDYAVSEGTPVKAIHEGTVTRVRFGRWGGDKACAIRTWIKEKGSQAAQNLCKDCEYSAKCTKEQTCRKRCCQCKYVGGCYGIQLWLQWSKRGQQFAYYAHLSKLSDAIWGMIQGQIQNGKSDYNVKLPVSKGDVLGYSGCTGNACWMKPYQEHLHFEYRKDNEDGYKDHPNYIVGTKFKLDKGLYEMLEDRRKIDKMNQLHHNKVVDDTARKEVFTHIDSKIDTFISKIETKK